MSYKGLCVTIPLGKGSLNGNESLTEIPATDLQSAEGIVFENRVIRKMPGAVTFDTAGIAGAPGILAGYDFWPDDTTQRTLLAGADGVLYKEIAGDTDSVQLTTGLSTLNRGTFVEGGSEMTGQARKVFYFDGAHTPKIVTGDGAAATDIATPPLDWTGSTQPAVGLIHGNRLWGFLGHQAYYSSPEDHQNFQHAQAGNLNCYPGVGRRIMLGLEHDERLYVFKYPKGIFILEDTDVRPTYWSWVQASNAIGVCPSPKAAVEVPGDILFLAPGGSFHLLTEILKSPDAETIQKSDLSERLHIKGWMRDTLNLARLDQVQSVWFEHKSLAIFAIPKAGETANYAKLLFDFSRYGEDGTILFSYDFRDDCSALWLRRGADRVERPIFGDSLGMVYEMDQTARNNCGAAYRSTFRTAETDFGYLDPGMGVKKKNFDFLELVGTPKGLCSLPVTTYLDGVARQTLTFDANRRTDKARIRGAGQFFSVEIDHEAADEDFSLSAIRVYFRPGREVPVGSSFATAARTTQETNVATASGYQDVAENATSVTVIHASATGTYIPTVTPNWNTKVWESSHLEGRFTFGFDTPAPPSAYIRWTITPTIS